MKQTKTTIDILIVNYNSADFTIANCQALQKLTYYPSTIHIIDNHSSQKDYFQLTQALANKQNIHITQSATNFTGSAAHASGLDQLVTHVKSPYFCVIDPDAFWLKKHWDKFTIDQLDAKHPIIGTQATGNKQKHFPVAYAMVCETKTFFKIGASFKPDNIDNKEDVGYLVEKQYQSHGLQGIVFEYKNTRYYKKGPFRYIICAEYYDHQNELIVSHFSRGSSGGKAKYAKGKRKLALRLPWLGPYIIQKQFSHEKTLWIKQCQKIIDQQIQSP